MSPLLKRLTRLTGGLLLTLAAAAIEAQDVYVQSDVAPLLEAPAFDAGTLIEHPRGTGLTVLSEQDSWLEVNHEDGSAWVSRWLVGPKPPTDRVSHLEDGELDEDAVRRRASSVATAGAVRGLAEGDTDWGGQSDFEELEYMESLMPDGDSLADFQRPLSEERP